MVIMARWDAEYYFGATGPTAGPVSQRGGLCGWGRSGGQPHHFPAPMIYSDQLEYFMCCLPTPNK